ncbi:hypothetical protein GCM10009801_57100 [Streptomyces albiaxialis]|uniref:GPP34 family phosphoprotein n=2 Tax=Streptomyces albiaxialis TaxID=329523 RepID=A0ABN2WIH1_9ACTN
MNGMDTRVTDTLPARLFLLACDAQKGRLTGGAEFGYAVRAAVLSELEERGCLRDEGGRARPAGDRRTGDPVLDGVLREIAGYGRLRKWHWLVHRKRRDTCLALEQQLESAGMIKIGRGTFGRKRFQVADPALTERLRADAETALLDGGPVKAVPRPRAALTTMAALAHLSPGLSRWVTAKNRKRLKELIQHTGVTGIALKKALDSRKAAMSSGGGGG